MSLGFDPHDTQQSNQKVYANNLSDAIRAGKYMHWAAKSAHPFLLQFGTQATPVTVPTMPTAVQDNIVAIRLPGAVGNDYVEMYQHTAQTLMPSVHASKGLEIALDQVDNETVEYVPGGNRASNPLGYTAGTDQGVFLRAELEIANADGMDQFLIGWRKQEAYAVPTSFLTTGDGIYTDFVGLGFAATVANPNPLAVAYDLNNSGSTTVFAPNFTVADSVILKLEVQLSARKFRGLINGVPLGGRVSKDALGNSITAQNTLSPPVITMDSGDFLIPFILLRQDALLSTVFLRSLTCGPLSEENLVLGGR